jgi:hypothetical protein
MSTLRVRVTKEDIRGGKRSSCLLCPVALAVKRATGVMDARVHSLVIHVGDQKYVATPVIAKNFMDRFDNRQPVEPIEFDIPSEGVDYGEAHRRGLRP